MPSSAFTVHLSQLLEDADDLDAAHRQFRAGSPSGRHRLAYLNRAAVVASVSAWESYIEELMRLCLEALRPPTPPLGAWPALSAFVLGLLSRFHTPNTANVSNLVNQALGLPNLHLSWTWPRCTSVQAVARLEHALNSRHQIAHGINPRPNVLNGYSSALPSFVRKLARCTDNAVRHHLIHTHHLTDPWPG